MRPWRISFNEHLPIPFSSALFSLRLPRRYFTLIDGRRQTLQQPIFWTEVGCTRRVQQYFKPWERLMADLECSATHYSSLSLSEISFTILYQLLGISSHFELVSVTCLNQNLERDLLHEILSVYDINFASFNGASSSLYLEVQCDH